MFFDLNLPFLEGRRGQASEFLKNTRLRLSVKAMELGYSGVAYNHSVRGFVSDSDRCTIPLFPVSSLLHVAPILSTSVKFHRHLLNIPPSSPFRQYTRLTVSVDNATQASSLTSGNPILRTYDLVAVTPLNQAAFDQACRATEVDLIAVDFSQQLPFRLKLPMVKMAIERGIHFEITYSHLISDVQLRRQTLVGAKLLVDWTGGKNLILSSAAPTSNELRGPYDAANLSCLLGLNMECAKAAISKNCRLLISSALHKKWFVKEAVKIERISEGELLQIRNWDPISSGEGDLSLDDIARSFSDNSKNDKWSTVPPQSTCSSSATEYHFLPEELVSGYPTGETLKFSEKTDEYIHMERGFIETIKGHTSVANGCGSSLHNGMDENLNGTEVLVKKSSNFSIMKGLGSEQKRDASELGNVGLNLSTGNEVVSVVGCIQTGTEVCHQNSEYVLVVNHGQALSCSEAIVNTAVDDVTRNSDELKAAQNIEEAFAGLEMEVNGSLSICKNPFVEISNVAQGDRGGDATPPANYEQKQDASNFSRKALKNIITRPDENKVDDFILNNSHMKQVSVVQGQDMLKRKLRHPVFPIPFKGLNVVFCKKARKAL